MFIKYTIEQIKHIFTRCEKIYVALIIAFLSLGLAPLYGLVNSHNLRLASYDLVPITPATWQQVKLTYSDIIDGKKYPAEITLLRPIAWLKKHGLDKVGDRVKLSIPEFGVVDVNATVIAIGTTSVDTSDIDLSQSTARVVIGKFKRYAKNVRAYTFRNKNGNIEKINATPNHRFFVRNRGEFIAIKKVSANDSLINQLGEEVKLVCSGNIKSNCGKQYNTDRRAVAVYNLEVYQKHFYYVGFQKILVHNNCFSPVGKRDVNQEGYATIKDFEEVVKSEKIHRDDIEKLIPSHVKDSWVSGPRTAKGFKYEWNDGELHWHIHGHSADASAPAGSESGSGDIIRVAYGDPSKVNGKGFIKLEKYLYQKPFSPNGKVAPSVWGGNKNTLSHIPYIFTPDDLS